MLTGKLPYRRKFRSSLKIPLTSFLRKIKTKLQYLEVKQTSRKKFFILSEILAQIIPQQINSEKRI